MGIYDEQIKQRQLADEELFEESFLKIAGAIMGKRLSAAINDKRQQASDAVGEILNFYHVKPREVPENIKDMNQVLEYLLRPYGIMRRTVTLSPGWRKDASGAMLGTLKEDGSIIALIPRQIGGYKYRDPRTGENITVNGRNESAVDSDAMAFYYPFPMKEIGIKGLMRYITDNLTSSDMLFFAVMSLLVTLTGMIMPYLSKVIFADVAPAGNTGILAAIGVFMICSVLAGVIFGIIRDITLARISTKLGLAVESAAMMRVLSLPADFFKKYGAGELTNRIQYINVLAEQIIDIGLSTGLTSLLSLIYIFQVFSYAPALVVPALTVTLVTVVVSVAAALMQMKISGEYMELASKERGMSYALMSGIQKIRLSGAEKRAFSRWGRLYAEEAERLYNPPMFLKVNGAITLAITLIGTMVMYYTAVVNNVSVAEYYAFNVAYGMVSMAFMALAGIAPQIAGIKPILEMARPILDAKPEVSEEKPVIERISGAIELNNITFRYNESMPAVLDNLSMRIRPGQYVAIVGKTGCGKSTLMRVLLGLEQPQKGAVYYDGRDISRIDLKSLRSHIGVVMQNGKLFPGDIYSNIVISAPQLTLDDAWEAAEIAGIADDIRDMPMGMFTIIAEGQGGISGGQKQRLMIARAVAPKPKVIMLDEATSALDNITQRRVSEAMDKLKCTRIVIAHRLSTIKQCDRIIVLDQGRIVEDGKYDELIKADGFFAELVNRQLLGDKND